MFDISSPFMVQIEGRGKISVKPTDHVASGGEGHVYRPGGASLALKIWDDPHRALSGRMVEKIKLLSVLKDSRIVAPETLARDRTGNLIGYVMPWVTGWDLPLAFTNDWRAAHGFDDAKVLAFTESMRQVTLLAHTHAIIMGDANELNILGDNNGPRYIDVDPWLPPGFAGDKIMPTIQDHHAPIFTKEADWFAWAVVTFQLWTGVHPYRGTHPNFKRSDLEKRMRANVSVFDNKIRLNAAVRPLSHIPSSLRRWYESVFQQGERSVPPEIQTGSVIMASVPAKDMTFVSGKLKITEAFTLPAAYARRVAPDVILLTDGSLISLSDGRLLGSGPLDASYVSTMDGGLVAARVENGYIEFGTIRSGTSVALEPAGINAEKIWAAANRLFAVMRDGILELTPRNLGQKNVLLTGRKWPLNANATVFGDGVALFDALGAKYLVLPQADKAVAMVRMRELDKMKPVVMLGSGRTSVMSLIDNAGAYHRAMITVEEDLAKYKTNMAPADDGSLSDVILNNGLILWATAGGELGASTLTNTSPLGAATGGRLIAGPSGVFSIVGDKVLRLSMAA